MYHFNARRCDHATDNGEDNDVDSGCGSDCGDVQCGHEYGQREYRHEDPARGDRSDGHGHDVGQLPAHVHQRTDQPGQLEHGRDCRELGGDGQCQRRRRRGGCVQES